MVKSEDKYKFIKLIALLASSGLVAQLIGVASAPIIARLYSPGEIGLFGQIASFAAILTAVSTLRFDDALFQPSSEVESKLLFITSVLNVFCVIGFFLILFVVISEIGGVKLHILPNVYVCFLVAFVGGVSQALAAWRLKSQQFRLVAKLNASRSAIVAITKIAAGLAGEGVKGLLAGQLLGDFFVIGATLRHDAKTLVGEARSAIRVYFVYLAKYKDYAIFGSLQTLIATAWIQAPVILLGMYYGSESAGYYTMALLLLQYPVLALQSSLRQVSQQQLSQRYGRGVPIFSFIVKITLLVYLAYAVPCLAILYWAPEICSFIFGAVWQDAGHYAQILVFSSFISVGKIPYIALIKIFRVQGTSVLLDISALIAQVSIFLFFAGDVNAIGAIKSFAVIFSTYNISVMIWMARAAKRYDKSLEPQP